jgi:hypothetical protein
LLGNGHRFPLMAALGELVAPFRFSVNAMVVETSHFLGRSAA